MKRHPAVAIAIMALTLVRTVAAQAPPSQTELNGYMLGQHLSALERALGEPFQQQRTPDDWTYRAYMLDSAMGAYMVFKFTDERPDYVFSVQITGDPGTDMVPFLGLRLGDDTATVLQRIGRPSSVQPVPEWHVTLWSYADRNYSVELDTLGRLFSIQIIGFEGFDRSPDSTGPDPLQRLRDALLARSVDSLMRVVTPDLEVFTEGTIHRFQGPARGELTDTTSAVAKWLYASETSLRVALGNEVIVQRAEQNVRVFESGLVGFVYKFPPDTPLAEILFVPYAGSWCVWEITFRS